MLIEDQPDMVLVARGVNWVGKVIELFASTSALIVMTPLVVVLVAAGGIHIKQERPPLQVAVSA